MIFWHLGASVALARYTFRDERMDLRFLMFGAILPDVVDTPLGLLGFATFGSIRLFLHTLAVAAAVMIVVVLGTRRGRPRKRWMPLAIGMLLHLALDAMWASPETLWWPFLGTSFTPSGAADAGDLVGGVLGDWRVWAGEGVGLLYLAVLARRAGLSSAGNRRSFLATGIVDAPIGR